MKHIRMIGLAAMAMALMAFVGASVASATTLDNGKGEMLSAGSSLDASLVGSAELTNTAGTQVLDTCTTGTIEGVTENTGSATETVKGEVSPENLTWANCTATTDTTGGGTLEIHWTEGHNGTVTGTTFEVTVNISGVSCNYGLTRVDSMVNVGTLIGSDTEPTLQVNAIVALRAGSFLCPTSGRWKAIYRVTSPTGLTVTTS
jgi:hypothetical protein